MESLAEQPDVAAASSANSYAILAKLATGGMAELFLARTASTAGVERYVVLKRVLPSRLGNHEFVSMFLDEARLAAQLQHPNIAQVFDTGKLGDSYFFSMEYVHGETVREILQRAREVHQPVPIGCTLTIAASAAAGLHHAHERNGLDGKPLGIVHRDVSPSNLMVSYEGNVKLVDFGVAKAAIQRAVETQTGTVKGKIGYLSPEQCRGRTSDRRGDLFSLGIVIWELLVGERLYKRDNDYDTMEAIVIDPPIAPSSRRADVPPALDAIVLKLLAKVPGDRYQTADELYDELEAVADSTGFRISNASLKRYLVELFGKRPEPWIEIKAHDASEVVTVSARVTGIDTTVTVLSSQLSNVLDLTRIRALTHPASTPAISTGTDLAIDRSRPASRRRAIGAGLVLAVACGSGGFAWVRAQHQAHAVVPADAAVVAQIATPPPLPVDAATIAPTIIPTVAASDQVEPTKPVATRHRASPGDDLAAELRAGRAREVVASCASSKVLARNATTCTLAACRAHDASHATMFGARIATTARSSVIAECQKLGVTLEAKPEAKPTPTCATDPALCKSTAPAPTCATDPALCKRPPTCDDPLECRK